ncbi:hypothetical protein CDAR_509151 [Caerostris darwini]|uniref:Uncharacterized protein n=1 Tax=Caerostris darwini TaxID=1538125 RepID=A0AAV4N3J4_9ARAC|nr:hypothetical protein CDAR_509151 [Caerostris darwini]
MNQDKKIESKMQQISKSGTVGSPNLVTGCNSPRLMAPIWAPQHLSNVLDSLLTLLLSGSPMECTKRVNLLFGIRSFRKFANHFYLVKKIESKM